MTKIQMEWYKLDKKCMRLYYGLTIASLFYIFPIILADRYYNDDLARSLYGATGWIGDGRPIGECVILALCGGGSKPIVDIFPLPLILATCILSYVLILYAKVNFKAFAYDYMYVLVLLFVITNPFAMSNLSYRFDCITMFTALSVSFLIYSVPETISRYWLFLCSCIASILVMSLYQPAIGMCIVLWLINIYFYITGEYRKQIKQDIIRMLGIIAGTGAYKFLIANYCVSENDWRYEASHTVSFLSLVSIKTVFNNIVDCCCYIFKFFLGASFFYKLFFLITTLISISYILVKFIRMPNKSIWCRILNILVAVITPILIFITTFLPMTILRSLGVKSRIFISFGGFLLFIGILLMYLAEKHKKIAVLLLGLCLLNQYTFMYLYGNALKSQKEYEKYMVNNIVHDLETINNNGEFQKISIIGNMPRSRQVQMICNKYPFYNEIVPVYLNNSTWIGGAWVYHYMQEDLTIENETDEDIKALIFTEPVIKNSVYRCYVNSEKIIIYFPKEGV